MGEQGAVEDASFGWFALVVEVPEAGEDTEDLIESLVSVVVGGRETVEVVGDRVQAGADTVLFALEQVERDGIGVVGLDELRRSASSLSRWALSTARSSSLEASSWANT